MSTYRLTDDDREKITATMPMSSAGWYVLRYPVETFAAVEAIIAPIHARAETAEAEAAHWKETAYQNGGLARRYGDRAEAAEKRADDLTAVIDNIRALSYQEGQSGRHVNGYAYVRVRDLLALLPDDAKEAGRVHNHQPYRPPCNERRTDTGQLRGACLNDDGTARDDTKETDRE